MGTTGKVGWVLTGYAASVAAAVLAVMLRNALVPPDPNAPGMAAGGDVIFFVFVLGVLSLVPTGLALFFLRQVEAFWAGLAALAAVAVLPGLPCALVAVLVSLGWAPPSWNGMDGLLLPRIAISPFLSLGLLLAAVLCPAGRARRALRWALAAEAAVSAVMVLGFLRALWNR